MFGESIPTAAGEVCNLAALECPINAKLMFGESISTAAGEVCNLAALECPINANFTII